MFNDLKSYFFFFGVCDRDGALLRLQSRRSSRGFPESLDHVDNLQRGVLGMQVSCIKQTWFCNFIRLFYSLTGSVSLLLLLQWPRDVSQTANRYENHLD